MLIVTRARPAEPWPEADRLFRRDPGWRGADAAYSVPLGPDRTLWLFGDTYLGPSRRAATIVHNSIGVQTGTDPATAALDTWTGGTEAGPQPFFPAAPGTWLWPMAGAVVPGGVVVFLMRVRSARPDLPTVLDAWRASGSLTFFEVFDWTAALIQGTDGPVSAWRTTMLDTPPATHRIMPGAGALVSGDHLYAYGWRDGHELRPGLLRRRPRYRGHRKPRLAYLVRWPVRSVPDGLHDPEWWCGTGWDTSPDRAVPVVTSPATEFSVHRDEAGGGYVLTETAAWLRIVDDHASLHRLQVLKRLPRTSRALSLLGLLEVSLSVRRAPRPEGPWSSPVRLYTPKVARDVLIYAGKAHPQLGGDVLLATYAQIALKADRTLDDESLYYPRFVRAQLS